MKTKDVAELINGYARVYPDSDVTFANNKVPVTKIVYDEKSNSINLR